MCFVCVPSNQNRRRQRQQSSDAANWIHVGIVHPTPTIACGMDVEVVNLHAVLLLELKILLPQSVDSVNHDLDQLDLRVAKSVLVGDVISVS